MAITDVVKELISIALLLKSLGLHCYSYTNDYCSKEINAFQNDLFE